MYFQQLEHFRCEQVKKYTILSAINSLVKAIMTKMFESHRLFGISQIIYI